MYAENANDYVLILRQLFAPQFLDELKLLNYKIKEEGKKTIK